MRAALQLVAMVVFFLPAWPAAGQGGPPSGTTIEQRREQARQLAEKGYTAFEAGDYARALDGFTRAEAVFHAPVHLLYVARSYDRLGRWREALAQYQTLLAEQLPDYAPDAFRQAQKDGRVELAALQARVPSLAVEVRGVPRDEVKVAIDGVEIGAAKEVPLDPGKHAVTARTRAPNPQTVTMVVALAAGAHQQVEIDFSAAQGSRQPLGTPAPPRASWRPGIAPAATALGLGGAALLAGAIVGGVSLARVSDLDARCPGRVCPDPADADPISGTKALGNASTAMIVLGAAGVATGAALLVIRAARSAKVGLRLGPGSFHLTGAW